MPTELMFRQKLIMLVERTMASWMTIDWSDEVSQEELLAIPILQLE